MAGYLTAASRAQLYLVTLADGKVAALTTDARVHDSVPVWSPDGTTMAYFSNRGNDPDRTGMQELYLIEPARAPCRASSPSFSRPTSPICCSPATASASCSRPDSSPSGTPTFRTTQIVLTLADGETEVLDRVGRPGLRPRRRCWPMGPSARRSWRTTARDAGERAPRYRRHLERRLNGKVSVTGLCAGSGHIAVVSAHRQRRPGDLRARRRAAAQAHPAQRCNDGASCRSVRCRTSPSRAATEPGGARHAGQAGGLRRRAQLSDHRVDSRRPERTGLAWTERQHLLADARAAMATPRTAMRCSP